MLCVTRELSDFVALKTLRVPPLRVGSHTSFGATISYFTPLLHKYLLPTVYFESNSITDLRQ